MHNLDQINWNDYNEDKDEAASRASWIKWSQLTVM